MEKIRITVSDLCPLIDCISMHSTHLDADGIKTSKLINDLGFDSLDFVRLIQCIEQLEKMHGYVVDESIGNDLFPLITVSEFIEAVNKNIRSR